jgi:hypothetical protein
VIEVLEEAVHLLRLAPPGALLSFYAGSVPFVLGFLYFWSDMSRSAFARRHVADGSLVMALLYIWMKAFQAVFARQLRARLSGRAGRRLSPSAWARHLLAQAALQPTSLFVLPLAALVLLPYGWAYAFYQNLSVTGDGAASRRQALLWPRQNHAVICVLLLFDSFVFLNLVLTVFLVPLLLKVLFGIETAFSRSPLSLLNTTLFMTACGLSYLVTAPFAKAAYAVRCFHGDSLGTGEDLRAELRALAPAARRVAAIVLLVLALCAGVGSRGSPAYAAASRVPAAPARVPPGAIDRAIREVAAGREFAWRLPRAPEPDAQKGIVTRFFEEVADLTMGALRSIGRLFGRLFEALARMWGDGSRAVSEPREGLGWLTSIQILLAILLVVVACAAALFFWRSRRRRSSGSVTRAEAVPAIPDVLVDDSTAATTPADGWLERARELARQGDLRQAIRALYLACLSHLAAREFLILARFKSNRDYQGELRRRGRARPELGTLFAENVALFEHVWYGRHEATEEMLKCFTANFERLRAHAQD